LAETFEEWAILELMGHRKEAGLVREVSIGGASFIRIDVPGKNVPWIATQYYNPSAVYCMTPVSEELARQVAMTYEPQPVTRYELPAASSLRHPPGEGYGDDDDDTGG
jgi:hypothetical protein